MSLLSVVQGAALRCNVPVPAAAFSSMDPLILQMVAFAQDSCQDLSERWDWRNLKISAEIIGDGVTTEFSLPPDFARIDPSDKSQSSAFVSNVNPLFPLLGPMNDEDLNFYKALPVFTRPMWRLIGGAIEWFPAPNLNEVITFNYFSKNFILKGDQSQRLPAWTGDDDIALVPEDTVMKGVIWRWKSAKGLDYGEEMRQYELSLTRQASQEGQERTVATALPHFDVLMGWWPGSITDNTTPLS